MHERRQYQGLSEAEAAARLAADGYNELARDERRRLVGILKDLFLEPMISMLIICGGLYLILGDHGEALLLLCSVFIIAGINTYQQNKTENTLEALRQIASPRALVIRGGVEHRIAGREVVRGDIVIIGEGDRVPADGAVLEFINLLVDESVLTGESAPVTKRIWQAGEAVAQPGGDNLPFFYSGTLVTKGRAVMEVLRTGKTSELGKIGQSLAVLRPEKTRLEEETAQLTRIVGIIALGSCLAIVGIIYWHSGDFIPSVLAGLTLAMSAMPEEFPVVLTVFLALGAWRIAKKNVLARRVSAIEMLGSATVLCVDKTGTLTQNRMMIDCLKTDGHILRVGGAGMPAGYLELVEQAALASADDTREPMEKAIWDLAKANLPGTVHWHESWKMVQEYPLESGLLALTRAWDMGGGRLAVAVKGAPEAVIGLCRASADRAREILDAAEEMAKDGLRVLAVAKSEWSGALPDRPAGFPFSYVGLIGFRDPVRPEVPAAIKECRSAGIRVVMITGDYATTALRVADDLGLEHRSACVTGDELMKMTDEELALKAQFTNVFARVVPEHKLRIVRAFKANGEVVAMTGDGVNDAPALKAAHIGIAMGERGTDVAREASGLVLLDDNFASIVAAVRLGRRIYDNLKKSLGYVLAVHFPIIFLSLVPALMGLPLILLPAHIVFLELIIDPVCSVAYEMEGEQPGIMGRPPRPANSRVFDWPTVIISVVEGLTATAVALTIYFLSFRFFAEGEARLLTFGSVIAVNIMLVFVNRSKRRSFVANLAGRNPAFWGMAIGATLILGVVIAVPTLSRLFRFGVFHWSFILVFLLAAFVFALVVDLVKMAVARILRRRWVFL
ncbi:MAG: cation-translocating P-type ATPase [Patescibacteria group bacterium]|nr:cation-translocating P-type ATPase [Patescibacteria group bacterium]